MKFEYAPLSSLSDYKSSFTQDVLKNLVRLYSDRINKLTNKFFIAQQKVITILPYHDNLFKIPGPPVLKINGITGEYIDGSIATLDTDHYSFQEGNLLRLKRMHRYSLDELEYASIRSLNGLRSIQIDCVMGNVEGYKEVQVELSTQIAAYETSATLSDVSSLEPRDVLVFDNAIIIINSVDYESNSIEFDDVGSIKTIPIGAITTCYGQVPMQIEEAVKLFIKHHKKLQGFSGRIKSEKIGKSYSYDSIGLDNTVTGIAEIDSILFLYINDEFDTIFL